MKKGTPVVRISEDQKSLIINGYSMAFHEAKELAHNILDQVEGAEIWPKKRRKK